MTLLNRVLERATIEGFTLRAKCLYNTTLNIRYGCSRQRKTITSKCDFILHSPFSINVIQRVFAVAHQLNIDSIFSVLQKDLNANLILLSSTLFIHPFYWIAFECIQIDGFDIVFNGYILQFNSSKCVYGRPSILIYWHLSFSIVAIQYHCDPLIFIFVLFSISILALIFIAHW